MNAIHQLLTHFQLQGTVQLVRPLGNGLINDTYLVSTLESDAPDYVLQRINHHIFQNVEGLQRNIEAVTRHIRRKLEAAGADDLDRRVLQLVPTLDGKSWYYDGSDYWRITRYIPDSQTFDLVDPYYSRLAGEAFGQFEAMLADLDEQLCETIPDFHNMEFRYRQFQEALAQDAVGRRESVAPLVDEIARRVDEMCQAERLYREGRLPKRICHCDTKVNNMLFDAPTGRVLCVVDLDTVMPSFVSSDYGDFLRTAANTVAEDDPNLDRVQFRLDIFEAFTEGYLASAGSFLTPLEVELLPYAVRLFPYMQATRFLTDYLNGDTYYKIQYPEHNLVRTRNQLTLLHRIEEHATDIAQTVRRLSNLPKHSSLESA